MLHSQIINKFALNNICIKTTRRGKTREEKEFPQIENLISLWRHENKATKVKHVRRRQKLLILQTNALKKNK